MTDHLNGRFTSPSYPWYGRYQRCSLLIEAPRGHYIYVQFGSFHLEYGGAHCPYDYVEVFDGNSGLSPRITRACGQRQQAPCEIYSSGRFLFVTFRSDRSGQYRGFSAHYYALSKSKRNTYFYLIDISFSCVSLIIDHFNIVKVTVDRRGVNRVDPQTMRKFILWGNSWSITGQTHGKWRQFDFYNNKLSNCPLSPVATSHKL